MSKQFRQIAWNQRWYRDFTKYTIHGDFSQIYIKESGDCIISTSSDSLMYNGNTTLYQKRLQLAAI